MTEKRFELAYEKGNWWAVRDGEITLWKEEVIGLLNEQDIEIKRLKEELKMELKQVKAILGKIVYYDNSNNLNQ